MSYRVWAPDDQKGRFGNPKIQFSARVAKFVG